MVITPCRSVSDCSHSVTSSNGTCCHRKCVHQLCFWTKRYFCCLGSRHTSRPTNLAANHTLGWQWARTEFTACPTGYIAYYPSRFRNRVLHKPLRRGLLPYSRRMSWKWSAKTLRLKEKTYSVVNTHHYALEKLAQCGKVKRSNKEPLYS